MVSAIGVGAPVSDDVDEKVRPYYEAKHDADLAVEASGLNYTIVRPGGLTDDAGVGLVTLGDTVDRGSISREDVAAVIVAALYDPRTIGHAWELVTGEKSITDAIDAAL